MGFLPPILTRSAMTAHVSGSGPTAPRLGIYHAPQPTTMNMATGTKNAASCITGGVPHAFVYQL